MFLTTATNIRCSAPLATSAQLSTLSKSADQSIIYGERTEKPKNRKNLLGANTHDKEQSRYLFRSLSIAIVKIEKESSLPTDAFNNKAYTM